MTPLRILLCGELNGFSRTHQRFTTLQDLGHVVTGITTLDVQARPGATPVSLVDKVLHRV